MRPVRPEERARWRSTMAEHHYLGFRGLVGESLYYVACIDDEWVALLGWAAAAWMCRPRDRWIGWTRPQQWARLRYIVNNARFLILPDVHIPNLASKTLALNTRRLSSNWQAVYGHAVLVAETFVDPGRFAGTSYRAQGGNRSARPGDLAVVIAITLCTASPRRFGSILSSRVGRRCWPCRFFHHGSRKVR